MVERGELRGLKVKEKGFCRERKVSGRGMREKLMFQMRLSGENPEYITFWVFSKKNSFLISSRIFV